MLYSATHITRHLYQSPVSRSLNELRLTPRSLPGQQVREIDLCIQPEPATLHRRKDYFGNDVTTVAILETHHRFVIKASSIVEVQAPSAESASTLLGRRLAIGLPCTPMTNVLRHSNSSSILRSFPAIPSLRSLPGQPLLPVVR